VQRELAALGYYQGPIDGLSGPQTEDALRWFQAVNHLPVTGQIDGATVQALPLA
jgi:peptidoglycan hydrolase-like protein with peptidoglycan-binding domain